MLHILSVRMNTAFPQAQVAVIKHPLGLNPNMCLFLANMHR